MFQRRIVARQNESEQIKLVFMACPQISRSLPSSPLWLNQGETANVWKRIFQYAIVNWRSCVISIRVTFRAKTHAIHERERSLEGLFNR